jgi:hypothetical protein
VRRASAQSVLSSIGSRCSRGHESQAASVRMGARPRRHEMRSNPNGSSPATWNELSQRHAIEMRPSVPHACPPACAHVRLSPPSLGETVVDGCHQGPRRHIGRRCACLLNLATDCRYRWLQRGAVGHQGIGASTLMAPACECGLSCTPPPTLSGTSMPTGASTTSEPRPLRLGRACNGGRGRWPWPANAQADAGEPSRGTFGPRALNSA